MWACDESHEERIESFAELLHDGDDVDVRISRREN